MLKKARVYWAPSQLGNLSHRPCLYLVTRVTRMLRRHYMRGYKCDTVVTRALCGVYECYMMSA